jgi:hypothetical protein
VVGVGQAVLAVAEEIRVTRARAENSAPQPVHLNTCEGHAKPAENSGDPPEADRAERAARGQLVSVLLLVNVLLVIVVIVAVLT